MVNDGYLYADAHTTAQTLGYGINVNDAENTITMYETQLKRIVVFNSKKKVLYYHGYKQEYMLPCNYVINSKGAWVVKPDKTVAEYFARTTAGNGLRMREGPSTGYNVCGLLSNNEGITVCGYSGEWSYIRFGAIYGWVKTEYIE